MKSHVESHKEGKAAQRGRKVGQPSLGDQHLIRTKIPPYQVFKKQKEAVNPIASKKGKDQGLL